MAAKSKKTPKKKASHHGGGWFKKLLLLVLLLGILFVVSGFWGPGDKTLLKRADHALGIRQLQPAHDRANAWVRDALGLGAPEGTRPVVAPGSIRRDLLTHPAGPGGERGRFVRPGQPPAPIQPAAPGGVIVEKHEDGQSVRRLEKMGEPMGKETEKDQRLLDDIIKQRTKK